MGRYRSLTAVSLAIAMSALIGGLFGRNALATDDRIPQRYETFTKALSVIEKSYVEKVEPDTLVTGVLAGCEKTGMGIERAQHAPDRAGDQRVFC